MFKCAFVAECRAVLRSLAFLWCIHTYAYHYWLHGRADRGRERVRTVCICTMYSPIAGSKMHICENALTAFGLERSRLYLLPFFLLLFRFFFFFSTFLFWLVPCSWSSFLDEKYVCVICVELFSRLFFLLLVFLTSEFASSLIVSLRFRYICFFYIHSSDAITDAVDGKRCCIFSQMAE